MNVWILVAMMLVAIVAVTWAAQAESTAEHAPVEPVQEGPNTDVSE